MKMLTLSLIVLMISAEAFAQRRGPRNPGHGRVIDRPGVDDGRPGRGGDAPRDHRAPRRGNRYEGRGSYDRYDNYRPGRVVVSPRYTPYSNPRRYHRPSRRPPVIWSYGFGYSCGTWGDLMLNGRHIHSFSFQSECFQALDDIRIYGDFCDREDLYDQSGILEAQFYSSYECREALGWYY